MRHLYLVTYDICDPKRLRLVYRLMLGYGEHLQYSVFQCELNAHELVELRDALGEIIHHGEDQVLFAKLGPVDGRGPDCIESLGRPYVDPDRTAIIV